MGYQQYQGGYYPQQPGPQGAQGKQKKEVLNKVEMTGIVRPFSKNPNDPVKLVEFGNGGGVVHFGLKIVEPSLDANGQQKFNEQGQPTVTTTSFDVDVFTNKNITKEMLSSVVGGMKVHVVGRIRNKYVPNKKTGQNEQRTVCEAYVFDILAGPMEQNYGGMPPYGQQPVPVQPYGAQGGYAPQYPAQQGGYPQPQMPYQQAPMYPQTPAQGYQQGGYMPQPQAPQQYPAPQQGYAPQQQPAYQRQPQPAQSQRAPQPQPQAQPRPQTQQAPPPYYQPGPAIDDDLPVGDMPEFPADAPHVRDINL